MWSKGLYCGQNEMFKPPRKGRLWFKIGVYEGRLPAQFRVFCPSKRSGAYLFLWTGILSFSFCRRPVVMDRVRPNLYDRYSSLPFADCFCWKRAVTAAFLS